MPEISTTRRSQIAWTSSLLFHAVLLFFLWQIPALRQGIIEILPKDQEKLDEQADLRKEMEKRIEAKRETVKLDKKVKEQILARLEQENTHRALEKVQELKQVYDRMVEQRNDRVTELLEVAAQKPVTDAAQEVQTALMETARRNDFLAERLAANADKDVTAAGEMLMDAEQLAETATQAREQAAAIDGKPTEQDAAKLRELAATSIASAGKAQQEARDLTTKANAEAVKAASESLLAAVDAAMIAEPAADALNQPDVTPIQELSTPTKEIANTGQAASLEDAWKAANEIEGAINSTYDQIRAAELAQVAQVSLAEAAGRVLPTPTPERANPFVQAAAASEDASADLSASTAAMKEAERQVGEIAQMAANRLALAQGLAPAQTKEMDAGKLFAQHELQQLAFTNKRFSDVASLMRSALEGEGGDDKDKDREAGAAQRADSPPVRRQDRLTDGAVANALPGRRFSKNSSRKGWLYLDTWYVIGPWPNSDTTTFEPVHPPEQEINLDARYEGSIYTEEQAQLDARRNIDRGYSPGLPRQLRWKFTQSDGARLVVPDERGNSTYYAYTDVFFEEAQEMLVSMGTDDSGRLWINGLPVGQDKGLSPWAIDETVRKVYFQKGYNPILVRLENGPKDAELSFLICPPEALR